RLTNVYSLISGINAAIVRAGSREALLADACGIAVATGGIALALVARVDELGVIDVVACEPSDSAVVREALASRGTLRQGSPIVTRILHERRPAIINDIENHEGLRQRALMLEHGLRSLALFPLTCGGQLDSVLCLFGREPGFFDNEEVKLLSEVGDNISF